MEYMFLAGAGEPQNEKQLAAKVVSSFCPADTQKTFVKYRNSIGPVNETKSVLDWNVGLEFALADGKKKLAAAIRETPNVPYLIGYSLGAYVVSEFLEDYAAGKYPDRKIKGALLIASPRSVWPNGATGIAGAHGRYPLGTVHELRNKRDMICGVQKGSPLLALPGIVAATTGEFFPSSIDSRVRWFSEGFAKIKRFPNYDDLLRIKGYVDGTEHVKSYFDSWTNDYLRRVLP